MLTPSFGSQLQDGLGIPFVKACSDRLLSVTQVMLTISYHSFLYSVYAIVSQKVRFVKIINEYYFQKGNTKKKHGRLLWKS